MAMMAKWKANGTRQVSNTVALTVPWPTHAVGDIGLLIVENRAQVPATLTTANGFVQVPDSPQSAGTSGLATAVGLTVFWCRATSTSMASPVVAFPGTHHLANIVTFEDTVETGDPFDVTAGDALTSGSTTVTIPGDTTTLDQCLIVAIAAERTDTDTLQFSSPVNADLSGVAIVYQDNSTLGNGGGYAVITGGKATRGAFGATTATLATASVQGRIALALKPRAGPKYVGAGPRASWSANHAGEDDMTPDWPAGHAAGDIGILMVEAEDDRDILFDDAKGFQLIAKFGAGGGDFVASSRLSVYWCRATSGAMESPVITLDDDPLNPNQRHFLAGIIAVRGCVAAGNPVHAYVGDTLDVDQVEFTVPGLTTSEANCLIVAIAAQTYDNSINNASGWANASLLSIAEVLNYTTSFGKGGSVAAAVGLKFGSGTVDPTTGVWQFSGSPNQQIQCRMALALTPTITPPSAPGGGPPPLLKLAAMFPSVAAQLRAPPRRGRR